MDRQVHRVHIFNRDATVSVSAHSAGAYTATLMVMVSVMTGGGLAPPTLTSQANFTLMTECTPESRRYYSVYSVDKSAASKAQSHKINDR